MKPTEFIKESIDSAEYNDEAGSVKTNLHTIVRSSVELAKTITDDENLPEWCQEKIAQAKGMIVAVTEYLQSQHEQEDIPTFNSESASRAYEDILGEDATGGGMGSAGVAVSMGNGNGFANGGPGSSVKTLTKKHKSYTNQRSAGGPVKVKK